jgi:alkaline phosphatase
MKKVDELNKAGTPTLIVSVSDHETGGLALAYQLSGTYPEYAWYPDALLNGTSSAFDVARRVREQSDTITTDVLRELLKEYLGVSDPDNTELDNILENKDIDETPELWFLSHTLSKLTSRRAQVGWSTEGHSGVDVNLYGYPRSLTSPYLGGNRENTEVSFPAWHVVHAEVLLTIIHLHRSATSSRR